MKQRIDLIKEYVGILKNDKSIWIEPRNATESMLQNELKIIICIIEYATLPQIEEEIQEYRERIADWSL